MSEQQPASHQRRREVRVFISSTFRDMQDEREELLKRVFPDLRRWCRERAVELTEIDLRWGVTEEEARQGKVVRICLDEVERCRPYFIGILGERYGWQPSPGDVGSDAGLFAEYPWLAEQLERRASLTELEIVHGALRQGERLGGAFFYFRAPRPGEQQGEGEAMRQERLKQTIRDSGLPCRDGFASPAELGEWVRQDLLGLLDERFPATETPSPLERQRQAHESYAASRLRSYVEDPASLDTLDAHVTGAGAPLVVLGESGVGKSALLACWARRYRQRHPETFLIEHYVGAESAGGDHLGLIRRVLAEIRERCGVREEVPSKPDEIEKALPGWFAHARQTGLVLVLDAVNQLEGAGRLQWLPASVPPWVRLIVSTLPGPALEAIERRKWAALRVEPLDASRRERLIRDYLGGFRKGLSAEQNRLLAQDQKCANPLFLRTVLEELRLFGSFEELTERLHHYLNAADLVGLFERVLLRLEGDYGEALVREVLSLTWASRRGLAEAELQEITGCTRLALSQLLHALDYHLMSRGGLLGFFHDALRQAVRNRYAETGERQRAWHGRLADYFEKHEADERQAEELPWQLQRAEQWQRLKESIADIPMFRRLRSRDQGSYELLGYWLALGDRFDMVQAYGEALARDERNFQFENVRARGLNQVTTFLNLAARYAGAEPLFRRALQACEAAFGAEHSEVATSLHNLAELLKAKVDYAGAEPLLRRALEINEKVFGAEHFATATSLNNLALLLEAKGDHAGAERLLRCALEISEKRLGAEHLATATRLSNLGAILLEREDYAGAEPLLRRALEIHEKVLGPGHPESIASLGNLGRLLEEKGDLAGAEPLLRRAVESCEKAMGSDHPTTAACLGNLGRLLEEKGDYDGAEEVLRRALEIREKVLGGTHPETAISVSGLAHLLQAQFDFAGADLMYRRALAIFEEALGPDHPSTRQARKNLTVTRVIRWGCLAYTACWVVAVLIGGYFGIRWLLSLL